MGFPIAPPSGAGGIAADILWIAQIQDETYRFFQQWQQSMQGMQQQSIAAMNAISTSLTGLGTQAGKTDKFFREWASHMALGQQRSIEALDSMGASLSGVAAKASTTATATSAAMGAVAGAVSAVTHTLIRMGKEAVEAFGQMIKESAQLAAHVNTLGVMLRVVGQNAGYSQQELARYEKQIVDLGVTTRAARQMLAEMVQQNLDLAKSTDLARVGLDISRIMMIDTSEAIQRLVHGVAVLNPLVLRHLRLIVDFEQAYRNAANQMGRNWETFSIAEKQNIAMNEVLRLGANIAGTYAETLDTVGGRVLDLARVVEQLQVEFGQLFQPAYSIIIMELTRALEDARHWLEENADAADEFGRRLAGGVKLALEFGERLLELLEILPAAIKVSGEAIVSLGTIVAIALAPAFDIEGKDLESRIRNLGTTAKQAAAIIVASFSAGITMIAQAIKLNLETLGVAIDFITYKIAKLFGRDTQEQVDELRQRFADLLLTVMSLGDTVTDSFEGAFVAMTEVTGLAEATASDIDDAGDVIKDTMKEIATETMNAIEKIKALNKEFAEAFAERAVAMARREYDEQVRLFRRLEDMQRRHMQRLEDIRRSHARKREDLLKDQTKDEQDLAEDAADRRADLEEEYAEEQAEIWREYYRELEDIQRYYLEDVEEAARQNDAVAVARLMRKRAKDRRDAAIERDRDLEDAERDYKKDLDELSDFLAKRRKKLQDDARDRLKDLDENLAEQLEDAARARQRELDELDIYQNRRMADIALADKRELEDLQRKHADQLRELGEYFSTVKYLTDSAIEYLLNKYGQYYKDDVILREAWYAARLELDRKSLYDPSGYGWGTPSPWTAPGEPGYYEPDPYGPEPYGGGYTPTPAPPQVPITQPWKDPTAIGKVPGSPLDPPSNIAQYCRLHPNDPVCAWYGLAQGGMFLASGPTPFMAGEAGQPEIVASVPLGRSMNYNINLSGGIDVSGVSPGMERDIGGELMSVLKQFGEALLAGA